MLDNTFDNHILQNLLSSFILNNDYRFCWFATSLDAILWKAPLGPFDQRLEKKQLTDDGCKVLVHHFKTLNIINI